MEKTKRYLRQLLFVAVLSVCLFLLPVNARAATVASGECGENLTWVLDDKGTLTISGTGNIESSLVQDAQLMSTAPWYSNRLAIKKVVIEEGVTGIGSGAFLNCANLTAVTIPEGVTYIASGAFGNCTSLKSVVIPSSAAFNSLTYTGMEANAFMGCSSLESMTLPAFSGGTEDHATVLGKFFGTTYFDGSIAVNQLVRKYQYGTSYYEAVTYYIPASLKSVTVTGGWIAEYAFENCINLTAITLCEGVSSIGKNAFSGCENLRNVTIPEGVTSIGNSAFYDCDGLTSINIPGSVLSIGDLAFSGCDNLRNVTIQEGVTTIGANAFPSLAGIAIPQSVTSVGRFSIGGRVRLHVAYTGTKAQWNAIATEKVDTEFRDPYNIVHYNANGNEITAINYMGEPCIYCSICDEIFDSYGRAMTWDGWLKIGGHWEFYSGGLPAQNRWVMDGSKWCYMGSDGHMVFNKWIKDGMKWCYVGSNGYRVSNRWVKDGNQWCYVGSNGYLLTNGWAKDGNAGWCFMNKFGYITCDKWVNDGIGWAYVNSSGYMVTNKWVKDGSNWCYVGADGYMVKNQWVKDGSQWCYIGKTGHMVTNGWAKDGSVWRWMNASGYITYSKWIHDGTEWCYINSKGAMDVNKWVKDGKYWAYVGADGYMLRNQWVGTSYVDANGHALTGTHTISGVKYTFDANGNLIG